MELCLLPPGTHSTSLSRIQSACARLRWAGRNRLNVRIWLSFIFPVGFLPLFVCVKSSDSNSWRPPISLPITTRGRKEIGDATTRIFINRNIWTVIVARENAEWRKVSRISTSTIQEDTWVSWASFSSGMTIFPIWGTTASAGTRCWVCQHASS